jgi:hypothetical protein
MEQAAIKIDRVERAGDYGYAVMGNDGEEQLSILLSPCRPMRTHLTVIGSGVGNQGVLYDGMVRMGQAVPKLRHLISAWSGCTEAPGEVFAWMCDIDPDFLDLLEEANR